MYVYTHIYIHTCTYIYIYIYVLLGGGVALPPQVCARKALRADRAPPPKGPKKEKKKGKAAPRAKTYTRPRGRGTPSHPLHQSPADHPVSPPTAKYLHLPLPLNRVLLLGKPIQRLPTRALRMAQALLSKPCQPTSAILAASMAEK